MRRWQRVHVRSLAVVEERVVEDEIDLRRELVLRADGMRFDLRADRGEVHGILYNIKIIRNMQCHRVYRMHKRLSKLIGLHFHVETITQVECRRYRGRYFYIVFKKRRLNFRDGNHSHISR